MSTFPEAGSQKRRFQRWKTQAVLYALKIFLKTLMLRLSFIDLFNKYLFLIVCMQRVWVTKEARSARSPLLELQVVVSNLTWLLELELGSSGRVVIRALKHFKVLSRVYGRILSSYCRVIVSNLGGWLLSTHFILRLSRDVTSLVLQTKHREFCRTITEKLSTWPHTAAKWVR